MEGIVLVVGVVGAIVLWLIVSEWWTNRRTDFCPRCGAPVVEVVALVDKHDRRTGRSEAEASVVRVCEAGLSMKSYGGRSDHFGWSYGSAACDAAKIEVVKHEAMG